MMHSNKKHKKIDEQFLHDYPADLIFPNYSEHSNRFNSIRKLLITVETLYTRKQTKRLMIDAILKENQQMIGHPGEYM
jgi:hypothetical protein